MLEYGRTVTNYEVFLVHKYVSTLKADVEWSYSSAHSYRWQDVEVNGQLYPTCALPSREEP